MYQTTINLLKIALYSHETFGWNWMLSASMRMIGVIAKSHGFVNVNKYTCMHKEEQFIFVYIVQTGYWSIFILPSCICVDLD